MQLMIGLPKPFLLGLLGVVIIASTSCVPLVAGAAVGYVAHAEGYRVENPIQKEN